MTELTATEVTKIIRDAVRDEVRSVVREELARASGRSEPEEPEIVSRAQAAEILGVDVHTVTRWAKQQGLPGTQLPGGEWRFQRSAVLEWMFTHRKVTRKKRRAGK